ncbi:hypothetical protein FDECE_9798 [Fusarium decemcellulare]|nr:hypothetical protein FDECE_9798 [Fusarium decemcellulare]
MSSLINKVKDAISSDKSTEQPEGTHGPHSNRAANTADPRVDSDRDHRAGHSSNLTGTGEYSSTGQYATTDTRNTYGTDGPASRTDGPHKSNVLNKADPRVDSDRDYSKNLGANPHGTSGTGAHNAEGLGGTHTGFGATGTTGTTGGLGHTTGTTGGLGGHSSGLPEGTTGPHSSRAANTADPRVDSDLDGSRNLGARGTGTYGETTTGGLGHTTGTSGFSSAGAGAHGPGHSSGLTEGTTGSHGAGGYSGTGATGTHHTQGTSLGSTGGAYGTGPAPNTAGPHKSDMLNKADPRVDSNLDGSKTVGRDKTFDQSNDYAHKDPTDAAQVPPSVLQKHVPSEISHNDNEHDHSRRHSVSHQEKHRGL